MQSIFDKINVLEMTDSLSCGGTERVAVNFCRYIDRNIFSIFYIAISSGGAREYDLKKIGVEYLVANGSNERILEFIKEKKIDIIHLHRSGHFIESHFDIVKRVRESNPRIIIIETNIFGKFDYKLSSLLNCSLSISKMMFNERYIKNAGKFDFSKMKVVYNPVDVRYFESLRPTPDEVMAFKSRLGIKENDFVIGKMGRPHIAKWGDLILEMMPYLVKAVPNVKMLIQSAPESRIKKVKKSGIKDNVIFLDMTHNDFEVALFYETIDVYIHSSKIGESFGMNLAEAGIFKKPVVVNSTPRRDNSQIELIDHMKTGIIANHPQTFARAVEYLFNNPRKRKEMGENGYVKISNLYEAGKITKQLEKVFVEKLVWAGRKIEKNVSDSFQKLKQSPDEEEIEKFKREYRRRLSQEFGELTVYESLYNILKSGNKIYQKFSDFYAAKND